MFQEESHLSLSALLAPEISIYLCTHYSGRYNARMDSEKTMQTPNLQSEPAYEKMQSHPELFMAARRGDYMRLHRILSAATTVALPSQVVVDVAEADSTLRTDGAVDVEGSAALVTAAEAINTAWDSVLHVVASSGDGDEFLESASAIYGVASHLLAAVNKKGDTPLHCAARAGRVKMVTHLLKLWRGKDGAGDAAAKAAVRRQNGKGETALHEAVRLGDEKMVAVLLLADSKLARVVAADGTSPLYLAVLTGHDDIARQLHGLGEALSYSGPDGKNALHAAVVKTKETTRMILDWNKDLIKQTERSTGSTPLHFAASWGKHDVISLLLVADPSAAYQQDKNGLFPIHLAAIAGDVKAVDVLLKDSRRDCAELRDGRGRNFLHVAVEEENPSVVRYACSKSLSLPPSVMNIQDDEGDTALHLAVMVGNMWIFNPLVEKRQVDLNLTNNEGQTPLDLSILKKPVGVHSGWNPSIRIYKLLLDAGAQLGTHRWDLFRHNISKLDETEEAKKIANSMQTIGIASVLIATAAFTAAFAIPGGYRADDHENGGAPTLARHYALNVFIIADTLAFIFSGLSIASLIYANMAPIDIRAQMSFLVFAVTFMAGSARSLGAAFGFGLYVMLGPVVQTTAITACIITVALALIDAYWFICVVVTATDEVMLLRGMEWVGCGCGFHGRSLST